MISKGNKVHLQLPTDQKNQLIDDIRLLFLWSHNIGLFFTVMLAIYLSLQLHIYITEKAPISLSAQICITKQSIIFVAPGGEMRNSLWH